MDLEKLKDTTGIDILNKISTSSSQLANDIFSILQLVKSNKDCKNNPKLQSEVIAYSIMNLLSDPTRYYVIPADVLMKVCEEASCTDLGNAYYIINNIAFVDQQIKLQEYIKRSSVKSKHSVDSNISKYITTRF